MWNPPSNINQRDIEHYMIYIDGTNIHNGSETTYMNSTSNCVPNTTNISVSAVNRCGVAGPVNELDPAAAVNSDNASITENTPTTTDSAAENTPTTTDSAAGCVIGEIIK